MVFNKLLSPKSSPISPSRWVLDRRYTSIPNRRTCPGWDMPALDLLVFDSPCPLYCVAGCILRSTNPVFAGFLPIVSSVRCAGKLGGRRRWKPRFFSAVLLKKAGWSSWAHSTGKRCLQLQLTASFLWLKRRIVFSPSLWLSAAGLILSVLSKCHKINGLSLSPSILSRSASHWNSK